MRRKSRKHERGTALPEAGIVAPIFAMMFLMAGYLGKTYETKFKTLNESRYTAFNSSVNGCAGGADEGNGNFNSVPNAQPNQGESQTPVDGSSTSTSLLTAHAQSTGSFSFWFDAGKIGTPQTKTIHSKSEVLCTEEKHGINVFSYLGQMFSQVP
jgi:hypothetical protein